MPVYIGNTQISNIYFGGSEHSAKTLNRLYFTPGSQDQGGGGEVIDGALVDIFTVGGGGGGGAYNNYFGVYPGGGAGGYTNTNFDVALDNGTYVVEVGAGGAGGYAGGGTGNTGATVSGVNGSSSSFDSVYYANGGGGGYEGYFAGSGGSGGGAGSGGAGGSNGSAGGASDGTYGLGQGTTTREFGHTTTTLYAGGGGAGRWTTATPGGAGGGGNGLSSAQGGGNPINGTDNLGGGGGGHSTYPITNGYGGTGGSGIVKVRYVSDTYLGYGGEMVTSGSYKVHTFLSSDTFTVGTPAQRTSNLVIHYDAGNPSSYPGSGTTVTDLQGNVNGTLSGVGYDATDGGAFTFGADGDYINLGNNTLNSYLNESVSFTVGFWVNITTHGYLLDQGNLNTDPTGCLEFRSNTWGRNNDSAGFGISPDWSGTARDPINRGWHFIVGVKDGNYARLYLDGMLSNLELESRNFSGSGIWKIGRRAFNTSTAFGGKVSQVFIYNAPLTNSEVAQLYASTNRY